ncbi:MAG: hypothetical protein HY392_02510 [Candidatus Diapherotrites archaeon]|nr:hypothetical protein [Candidatus Diapherotrites archaeon]
MPALKMLEPPVVRKKPERQVAVERAILATPAIKPRWKMRGPTGKLLQGLEQLEGQVAHLESDKRKRFAVSTFLSGSGMAEAGVIPLLLGVVKGVESFQTLQRYLDKHKNHPRVMLYLADHAKNPFLKREFQRFGEEEIMLRKIIRSGERTQARLQHNMIARQMTASNAISEAHVWGVSESLIRTRKGSKL